MKPPIISPSCRFHRSLLLAQGVALLFTCLPLLAENIDLPDADFENGAEGWAVSSGGEVIEAPATAGKSLKDGVLALPPGAFANGFLDIVPQANTSYILSATLAPTQSELPANGKLAIFLYRGTDSRYVAEAHSVWAGVYEPVVVRVQYNCEAAPEEGWKLGVQIMSQDRGMMADAVSFSSEPLAEPIRLEGRFGQVEIDPQNPALK